MRRGYKEGTEVRENTYILAHLGISHRYRVLSVNSQNGLFSHWSLDGVVIGNYVHNYCKRTFQNVRNIHLAMAG